MIPYKGQLYKGLHEPVFTEEMFQKGLEAREKRKSKRLTPKTDNLLTGLMYCGDCGCSMRYQKWHNGKKRIYCCSRDKSLHYIPNHNPDCKNLLYWSDDIDKQVEEKIKQISLNFKMDCLKEKEDVVTILEKQLESVKTKLKRLYGIYADGNDTVVEMITELEEESKCIKNKILEESSNVQADSEKKLRYEEVKKIADVWEHIDKKTKNKLLKSIVEKVVIVNNDIEIHLKSYLN